MCKTTMFALGLHYAAASSNDVYFVCTRQSFFKRQFRTAQANWGGRGTAGAEFEGAGVEAPKGM